jgi:DHA1 family bicyclomycin/chloramphenicol resistance-like MFS transporter
VAEPRSREFLAIIALCMGMGAVSVDLLLPAFPDMRADLGLADGSTRISVVITAFFIGVAVGQLVYGPLSDRFGRRRLLQVGMAVFLVGAVAAAFAPSLTALVAARFVWGVGAAAPRSLAIAMVRDTYEGDRMARTMSLLMAIFLLVPVVAPSVGTAILELAPWRGVVGAQIAVAGLLALWTLRLPETLHADDRRAVTPRSLLEAARLVATNRAVVGYGIGVSALFGVLTGFVGSAEVLFDEVFGQADRFALLFGGIGLALAAGSLLGGRLVARFGLATVLVAACAYVVAAALVLLAIVVATDGEPPLWAFVLGLVVLLPGVMVLIPNANTAAMAPLGHVAGMGAALLGFVSTAVGAVLGSFVDDAFDGSVQPFGTYAFAYVAVAAAAIVGLAGVRRVPRGTSGTAQIDASEPVPAI